MLKHFKFPDHLIIVRFSPELSWCSNSHIAPIRCFWHTILPEHTRGCWTDLGEISGAVSWSIKLRVRLDTSQMVQSGVNGYRWYLKAQKDVFPLRKKTNKKTRKQKVGLNGEQGWRLKMKVIVNSQSEVGIHSQRWFLWGQSSSNNSNLSPRWPGQ